MFSELSEKTETVAPTNGDRAILNVTARQTDVSVEYTVPWLLTTPRSEKNILTAKSKYNFSDVLAEWQ